jgi:hypothetical protein
VAKQCLVLEDGFVLKQLSPRNLVADIGLVGTWKETQKSCFEANAQGLIETKAAEMVADILALSLFDGCLDGIMLHHNLTHVQSKQGKDDWFDAISQHTDNW